MSLQDLLDDLRESQTQDNVLTLERTSEHIAFLEEHIAKTNNDAAKLDFLKSKGLVVDYMKTSDKAEPYLAYVIAHGSELDNLPTVNKLIEAELELKRLQGPPPGPKDDYERTVYLVMDVHLATEHSNLNDPKVLQEVVDNFKSLAISGYMQGYAHNVEDLYMEPQRISIPGGPSAEINVHALRGGDAEGAETLHEQHLRQQHEEGFEGPIEGPRKP